MNRLLVFLIMGWATVSAAQTQDSIAKVIDNVYREDQFYVAVTYNALINKPDNFNQNTFSSGLHFGFIRDMPINTARNIALGIGLGLSANTYNQNLYINPSEASNPYQILTNSGTYSKNKLSKYSIEIPFEFRWRTSTATEYRFFRVYTGFKTGYIFRNTSSYSGQLGDVKNVNLSSVNTLQYGPTLSFGYNTWNFYVYYTLNKFFNNKAQLDNKDIEIQTIKIGLIFYIL